MLLMHICARLGTIQIILILLSYIWWWHHKFFFLFLYSLIHLLWILIKNNSFAITSRCFRFLCHNTNFGSSIIETFFKFFGQPNRVISIIQLWVNSCITLLFQATVTIIKIEYLSLSCIFWIQFCIVSLILVFWRFKAR